MRELSAAQKEAMKKRIRRACCDMARKWGYGASFTSTGVRISNGGFATVFDLAWNHLTNNWDLYRGGEYLAGKGQSYPNIIAYVMERG